MTTETANLTIEDDNWVAAACTLPTVEQPLRRQEFDDLFATDVLDVIEESATRTRFSLRPDAQAASRAAALAVKETGCCSFFDFDLAIAGGKVTLSIGTAPAHQEVLAALTTRAKTRTGDPA
ncbi:hypothetical protein G6553_07315 [Nocardioides sp. IC4_145]|uniref:hypothetical protein n=1 Tax=Nocardioides sp. IC4_145 TaxID=2714037 RepID=UPI0014092CE7|nr:hypothetical protein [Nocardioides sp. IC4_145]NHC22978.1 hypothetical protein [Nocardioides sp. IC4_145]